MVIQTLAGRQLAETLGLRRAGGGSPEIPRELLVRRGQFVLYGQGGYRLSRYVFLGLTALFNYLGDVWNQPSLKEWSVPLGRIITACVSVYAVLFWVRLGTLATGMAFENFTWILDQLEAAAVEAAKK